MSEQKKVILITGASSGIGESTAYELAKAGHKLVLGARRTDRLESVAKKIKDSGGEAVWKALDVTKRDDFEAFAKFAQDEFGHIDVLVNNAGLMPLSPMSALKVDEWDRMVDVNIKGVLYGIAATLPVMKKQGGGQVINLSSVAGIKVFKSSAVYCGTKFAVSAISEGLRQEEQSIRVCTICPGATESELTHTITDPDTKEMAKGLVKMSIPADSIARAIAFAVSEPDNVDVNQIVVRPTIQEL